MSFPRYAYVPGLWPHPTRDPAGHSHGLAEIEHKALRPDGADWQHSDTYLRALELFDHGYYWEAHEGFEALWIAAGRQGAVASLLQGLIQLAAAAIKTRQGKDEAAIRLRQRASEHFDRAEASCGRSHLAGLDFVRLRTMASAFEPRSQPEHPSNAEPAKVVIVYRHKLRA